MELQLFQIRISMCFLPTLNFSATLRAHSTPKIVLIP